MSFIYCLVARSKNVILTEYTDYQGNFPQKSLELLRKVKSNSKGCISSQE